MVTILLKLLTFALEYSIIISKYDADHRVRKICVETQKKCKECYYENYKINFKRDKSIKGAIKC